MFATLFHNYSFICSPLWERVQHCFELYVVKSSMMMVIAIQYTISETINSTLAPDSQNHLNPFPHTTILQQTTLNIFCQKIENLYNWMDKLWLKVENIVAKGEIARFEQFLLLSLCFQKAVCCKGVKKHLYEEKG